MDNHAGKGADAVHLLPPLTVGAFQSGPWRNFPTIRQLPDRSAAPQRVQLAQHRWLDRACHSPIT